MTTVTSQRSITTATTNATTSASAPTTTIEPVPSPPPAAATFAAAHKTRPAPFAPPPSPKLIDERTVASPADRQRVPDQNRELIQGYNKQYSAYLETYKAGVDSAPTLERIRHFAAPVSYAPAASLPVEQRARYDDLLKPALANQKIVHETIGARVLTQSGVKLPGAYAFAEVKTTLLGNGVSGRVMSEGDSVKLTGSTQVGLHSKAIEPELAAFGSELGVGITLNIDAVTGEVTKALKANAGAFGIELDANGKMTTEGGIKLGKHAELKAGSSYDGKERRAEVFGKAGVKLGELELEATAGVGVQFLTTEYVKQVIDSKGFFDDDKILALRSGGR